MTTRTPTPRSLVAALRRNAERYHAGLSHAEFTAEQSRLWGAARALGIEREVQAGLRKGAPPPGRKRKRSSSHRSGSLALARASSPRDEVLRGRIQALVGKGRRRGSE